MENVSKKPKLYQGGNFEELGYEESQQYGKDYIHAAHAMIYAPDGDKLWDGTVKQASILMQFRFDGYVGFPGGLLDKGAGVESVVEGLNRELEEEIGLDLQKHSFVQEEYMFSHLNEKRKIILHFYTKKITKEEYLEIEKRVTSCKEWGIETAGLIRVPVYVMKTGYRGFPVFLCNKFVGNSYQQLLSAMRRKKVIPEGELDKLLKEHELYKKEQLQF